MHCVAIIERTEQIKHYFGFGVKKYVSVQKMEFFVKKITTNIFNVKRTAYKKNYLWLFSKVQQLISLDWENFLDDTFPGLDSHYYSDVNVLDQVLTFFGIFQ